MHECQSICPLAHTISIVLRILVMRTQRLDPWLSITTDSTPRGTAKSAPAQSEASQKHEHDDYQKHEPQTARRVITPGSAVRPPRQSTKKCENQKYDQDRSQHSASYFSIHASCDRNIADFQVRAGRPDPIAFEPPHRR